MVEDYTRAVTHDKYKNPEKLKKYYHRVEKKIHTKPNQFNKNYTESKYSDYICFNEDFLVTKTGAWIVPVIVIAIFSAITLVMVFPLEQDYKSEDITVITISCIILIFFIIYAFTIPQKEHILNRRDGLITFTGLFWQPNITMPFKDAEFAYSTGGEDVIGAFQLQLIRPNKLWQTFATVGYLGSECYENMSFVTWYMDKNRPLPLGSAFDPFRDQDFERRKAEGFPKPLYPSAISTPEATKAQQAERKRIGGW